MTIKDLKVKKELKVISYDYRKTITWNNFRTITKEEFSWRIQTLSKQLRLWLLT